MKKRLLSALSITLLCCLGNIAVANPAFAPHFSGGALQFLSVCQNSTPNSINTLLAVTDTSTGDTEIWTALLAPTHGSLVAAYTTTSTGSSLTPTGLSYTPTVGYYGADSFSVVVSDGTQTDTTLVHIIVNNIPFGVTITGPAAVCIGAPVTLTSSATSVTWSATNGNANVVGGVVSGVTPGNDTIVLIATNGCGSDTVYHSMTVNPMVSAGTITGASAVCMASAITLSSSGTTGGTWSASNGSATVSAGVVTGNAYGMDTVSYIVSNACSADTARHGVRVDSALSHISIIVSPDHVCVGGTISLTDSVSGGVWSSMFTSFATVSAGGILSGVAVGVDTVVYTITNGCGTVTARKHVNVLALPNAGVIHGYDSVCVGSSISLTTTGTPGGTWSSSSSVNAAVSPTGVVTGALHGSAIITYMVTNACGSASDTAFVRVNVPAAPIIGSPTLCQGTLGVVIDPIPGGTWSTTDFIVIGPAIGGNLFGITLGTATVTYTLNNACGTTTATWDIEVIDCSAGINTVNADQVAFSISPDPNNGAFTVLLPSSVTDRVQCVITNMLGQKVAEFTATGNKEEEIRLDVPAGIYILSATVKGKLLTTRIVVTK